jgi:putative colanic acid biosynthesis acetyltransferase WcaF
MDKTIDLSTFSIGDYKRGRMLTRYAWCLVNYFIFNSSIPWPLSFKVTLLRLFGAKIGKGLIIKIRVRIKYPWHLTIRDHCWVGEDVWIDNLEQVTMGNNVCLSQGAMLLTGNHDYTKTDFPYRLGKIMLEDGVWIGARSVVCPGVVCRTHSILTVNSVATKNIEPWEIHSGNPASVIRMRNMES